jgi:thiamine pyrophosphate-dependent acetolactate synthase large subunit-like protein
MLLTSGGLGTMGYALPAAIGAQMATRIGWCGPWPATAASR